MIDQITLVDTGAVFTPIYKMNLEDPNEALRQCLQLVLNEMADVPPYATILCWDVASGGADRRRFIPTYKANRPEDADRYAFFARLQKFFYKLGYTMAKPKNNAFEADDILALFASRIPEDVLTVIYTRDHDMLQLVRNGLTVLHDSGASLEEKLECDPSIIPLWKATVGDASDKIPGIRGFGAKSFAKLEELLDLEDLQNLQDIIARGDKAEIEEACDLYPDSKELGKINKDIVNARSCYRAGKLGNINIDGKVKITTALPMANDDPSIKAFDRIGIDKDMILPLLAQELTVDTEGVDLVKKSLATSPYQLVAFDYESYDLCSEVEYHNKDAVIPLNQEITGGSFTCGPNGNITYYLPVDHRECNNWSKSSFTEVVSTVLEGKAIAHNLPFETTLSVCSLGMELDKFEPSKTYDTHEMGSQVDENRRLGLKSLSKHYLGYQQQSYQETLDAAGASNMRELTLAQVLHYGCDDSFVTFRLATHFFITMLIEGTSKHANLTTALQKELLRKYIAGTDYDYDRANSEEQVDHETLVTNMPKIRGLLAKIANKPNPHSASNWMNSEKDSLIAMKQEAGWATDKISEYLTTSFHRFLENTEYTEWKEEQVPVKVTKTVKFLETVMPTLGLPSPEKVTQRYLEELYYGSEELVTYNPQQREYLDCLLSIRSKKEGVEWETFVKLSRLYTTREPKLEASGFECSLGSPTQKQYILYGMLGGEVRRRSKVAMGSVRDKLGLEGSPATDEGAFQMALIHDADTEDKRECIKLILAAVKAMTRSQLFWEPYKAWKHIDGKLRPAFTSSATRTRRPTGGSPNFLQLPKGGKVRGNVTAPSGFIVTAPDWSAQELRISGSLTQDENILSAYIGDDKKDVHSIMGSAIAPLFFHMQGHEDLYEQCEKIYNDSGEVVGMPYEQYMEWRSLSKDDNRSKVTNLIRNKRAKNTVFSMSFGGTAYSLVDQLLITMQEAEAIIAMREQQFPGYAVWHAKVASYINRWGFIDDVFGQRYHFRRTARTFPMRQVRQAANCQCQGAGAYMLAESARRFHDRKLHQKYNAYLCFPIYDELVLMNEYRCANSQYDFYCEVKECMEVNYEAGPWVPESALVPQIPEFEVFLPDEHGVSRWAVNGKEIPMAFTLDDIKQLGIKL